MTSTLAQPSLESSVTFEKDEEFQAGLADSLTAEHGKYDEISFTCLIVPLPEDDAEERPSKRQRSMGPDSGLISSVDGLLWYACPRR